MALPMGEQRKVGLDLIAEANLLEVNIQQFGEWTGAKTGREEMRTGKDLGAVAAGLK